MRLLNTKETLQVSGAQDETFNGFLIGSMAGFFIGAVAGIKIITRYPVIVISPNAVENTLKTTMFGAMVIGGAIGTVVGALMEDDHPLF